jgi:metallo-beta-lactamase class B
VFSRSFAVRPHSLGRNLRHCLFPISRVLYGGCLVKSTEADDLGNLADANVQAYPNTIRNVQQKFPRAAYVIPGHQGWASTKSLDHTLDLLQNKK